MLARLLLASLALSCSRNPSEVREGPQRGEAKRGTEPEHQRLARLAAALEPLHEKLGPPRPGDWLASRDERGQTFEAYVGSGPVVPGPTLTTIYIQPLGSFTAGQRRILALTADFLGHWFGVPVKTRETLPLDVIPEEARRVHPSWGDRQILTRHVLDRVLLPRIPGDALGYLAFTTSDLWPGDGWNFVFGEASLTHRVGVWSIYRKGSAEGSGRFFRLTLKRALQTATHEMGHMLGMAHCTAWQCAMNGSNSLEESDRRPLPLCPECIKKIGWATKQDLATRFEKLRIFCDEQGLAGDWAYYRKALDRLRGAAQAPAR